MFIPDPGSEFFSPLFLKPNFFYTGSRMIRIKEFKYFNRKKRFLNSRKYDPGCSSRLRSPDPDTLPIPDPGVKKGTRSRIRISKTKIRAEREISKKFCGIKICTTQGRNLPPSTDFQGVGGLLAAPSLQT